MKMNYTCPGFKAGGIAAGIKKNKGMDLGAIVSQTPAAAAAVFTRNLVQAAPVLVCKEKIRQGICQAVIVNSGNANCCTGPQGKQDASQMAQLIADALNIDPKHSLVASTGVIGQSLPLEKVETGIPALVKQLREDGMAEFAQAILTTDTFPKLVERTGTIDGKTFTILGMAKGSGMIKPDMATMLCFICTDIDATSEQLQAVLVPGVDQSFNCITVDGDTSTNDMVLLMANGVSKAKLETQTQIQTFTTLLNEVMLDLAKLIVKDGEGATKLVEISVTGAADNQKAKQVAEVVAHSNLVKTALFGEDANWGRIIGAVGRSGVVVDPDQIDISFDDIKIVKNGMRDLTISEERATQVLKQKELSITIDLNQGKGQARVFTCDFSVEYVRINADYRS